MRIRVENSLEFRLAIGCSPITKETGSLECCSGHICGKKFSVLLYLDRVAESVSDRMPDKREYRVLFFEKRQVYDHFCEEYKMVYVQNAPSFLYFEQICILHTRNIEFQTHSCFAHYFFVTRLILLCDES